MLKNSFELGHIRNARDQHVTTVLVSYVNSSLVHAAKLVELDLNH